MAMLKQYFPAILFSTILTFSLSCATGNQKSGMVFENSKVYPSVVCNADKSQTYALFLPPQYQSGKPCPVLILFDAHGDGLLPVNLFSAEAAKNGFILAGSNNSKNGLTYEKTTAIYRSLLKDIQDKFTIEKKAIYLCRDPALHCSVFDGM